MATTIEQIVQALAHEETKKVVEQLNQLKDDFEQAKATLSSEIKGLSPINEHNQGRLIYEIMEACEQSRKVQESMVQSIERLQEENDNLTRSLERLECRRYVVQIETEAGLGESHSSNEGSAESQATANATTTLTTIAPSAPPSSNDQTPCPATRNLAPATGVRSGTKRDLFEIEDFFPKGRDAAKAVKPEAPSRSERRLKN